MKFSGKVIHGYKIASKFGISTANLELFDSNIDLKHGVYFVRILNLNKNGLLHFGQRKTFNNELSTEVHILDFSEKIYDQTLEIEVLKFEREIKKFANPQELFQQIATDVLRAKKFFLRQEIKNNWNNLTQSQIENLADNVLKKTTNNPIFQQAKNVFIYAPIKYEIPFVFDLMKNFPDKNFAFPVLQNDDLQFHFSGFEDLVAGDYQIPTPNKKNSAQNPDIVFVPALGADKTGHRLGRGKGFYDRFLKNCTAHKICVLPEFSVKSEIPVQAHDQKVDEVIAIR